VLTNYYSGVGGLAYGSLAAYGSLNLTETSPVQTFTEPLTLAQTKSYLNLPERSPVDTAEDDGILLLISGAREQAEILQGRDLVRKQWDMSLDYFLNYQIELRDPLVSVDLVQYKYSDATLAVLTENTDFIVDKKKHPGIITPYYNKVWPTFTAWPTSAVTIRFTSGFAASDAFWHDAGARVKNGMLLLISAWFNNRLPFELGSGVVDEYPYTVTASLSYGALSRAR
jgi:uncharacterized phiE125 gp8 family phage protein